MHALTVAVTRCPDPPPTDRTDPPLDDAQRLRAALCRPAPDVVHVSLGPTEDTAVTAVVYHRSGGAGATRAGIRHVDEAIAASGCTGRWQRLLPPG